MNEELYHYGVKGMKWGVRRNRDVSNKTREYRTSRKDDPKTDFLKINRANSAARSYYRMHTAKTLGTGGLAAVPIAAVVGVGANFVTGGHYYQGQSATYGSRRAEREIKQKKR